MNCSVLSRSVYQNIGSSLCLQKGDSRTVCLSAHTHLSIAEQAAAAACKEVLGKYGDEVFDYGKLGCYPRACKDKYSTTKVRSKTSTQETVSSTNHIDEKRCSDEN